MAKARFSCMLTRPGDLPYPKRYAYLTAVGASGRPAGARATTFGGSPEGVRATINLLHVLTYAEQATWSQLVTIPPSEILITPEQGEMFSLLRRDLRLSSFPSIFAD